MAQEGTTNFRLDPTNYLSIDNEAFRQRMLEISIVTPTRYFAIRRVVLAAVQKAFARDAYEIYYHLLTAGLDKDGRTSILAGDIKNECGFGSGSEMISGFKPCIPAQMCNEFAMSVTRSVNEIAQKAVDMILPSNFINVATHRVANKTAGDLFNVPDVAPVSGRTSTEKMHL